MADFTQRALQDFSYLDFSFETELHAPLAQVWSALTGDLTDWWGAPYLKAASARAVRLEPWVGGRLFELWGDNPDEPQKEGSLWGLVTEIADAELIELRGPMALPWPADSIVLLELESAGLVSTRLKLRHRALGRLTEDAREDCEFGWRDLLGRRLRLWVERGERLGIGHERMPWLSPDDTPAPPAG